MLMYYFHSCDFKLIKTIVNTRSHHVVDGNSVDGQSDGYFHKDSKDYHHKILRVNNSRNENDYWKSAISIWVTLNTGNIYTIHLLATYIITTAIVNYRNKKKIKSD